MTGLAGLAGLTGLSGGGKVAPAVLEPVRGARQVAVRRDGGLRVAERRRQAIERILGAGGVALGKALRGIAKGLAGSAPGLAGRRPGAR